MKITSPRVLAAAAGAIVFGSLCSHTFAQGSRDVMPIVFLTGFEPPAYLAGFLGGQDNWAANPAKPAMLGATVEKRLGPEGSPAVRIDAAVLNHVSSEWSRAIPYQMTPQMPVLKIEWDALLASSKMPSDAWQTLLYDPKGPLLCAFHITQSGASYLFQGPEPLPVPIPVPRDVWNHFEIRLNFSAATADFFLNGSPLTPAPIPAPTLTPDSQIGTLAFAVLSPGFDMEYLDNISVMPSPFICRPNCDSSAQPPILNVGDFMCFQKSFAEALTLPAKLQVTSYANFDGSMVDPVLNVNDYMAFLSAFAAGCR